MTASLSPVNMLPHCYPFLYIDRVVKLEQGACAVAECGVTAGGTAFPPILLVECLAQLAGILTISEEGEGGYLAAIERAEFHGVVPRVGDRLTISARVLKAFGKLFMIEGTVACDDLELLTATMTLGVGKL